MSQTLSLSLRPKNFKQLFGQTMVVTAIKRQIASGRMPAAWLFTGETGSGKTTLAKIMALSFQCTHAKFGFPCKECRQNYRSFCINEVNAAEQNKVEQITDIAQVSYFAPPPGSQKRVIILNELQRVTAAAQAVLLDYLETPPESTVWILTTTDPDKISKALRGRCFRLGMQPLRAATVPKFITWAAERGGITRDMDDFVSEVERVGVTSARVILFALERYAAGLDPEHSVLAAEVDVDTLRVCQQFVAGNWPPIRSELAKATAEDSRAIRSSLMGYLKSIVLNPKSTIDRKGACEAIEQLGRIQFVDDVAMSAMLTATLFRLCKKF